MLLVAGVANPLTTKIKILYPETLFEINDDEQETKKYIIINSHQLLFGGKSAELQAKIDSILNDTTVKKYVDAYTADINITLRQYYDKNLTFIAGNINLNASYDPDADHNA